MQRSGAGKVGERSKDVGLEVAHLFFRHFLRTEDLHYGYWPEGLEVEPQNLHIAQEHHSEFIASHVPEEAKTVLDVGGGAGRFARRLQDRGYQVDLVTPTRVLADNARKLLSDQSTVFECPFEEVVTDKLYDVLMFSESLQYIPVQIALERSIQLMAPGGHLLICDFFRRDPKIRPPAKGGHLLGEFETAVKGLPLTAIKELDITRETSPTMTLAQTSIRDFGMPVRDLLGQAFAQRRPFLKRLVTRLFRKRLEKINRRYHPDRFSAEAFEHAFTYRLFLFRGPGEKASPQEPVAPAGSVENSG